MVPVWPVEPVNVPVIPQLLKQVILAQVGNGKYSGKLADAYIAVRCGYLVQGLGLGPGYGKPLLLLFIKFPLV
jgi:hypothetical protein